MNKKTNTPEPHNHNSPFETEDSVLKGILASLGVQFSTFVRESGKVAYRADHGALDGLERLYKNEKIGALDALNNVKAARSAIYALKAGGR